MSIVDRRAASTDLFLDYFAEINVREVLGAPDARLTLVTPVNHEADSVEQLRLLSARLNGDCRYVVLKNQAHSEHFRIYGRLIKLPVTVRLPPERRQPVS